MTVDAIEFLLMVYRRPANRGGKGRLVDSKALTTLRAEHDDTELDELLAMHIPVPEDVRLQTAT